MIVFAHEASRFVTLPTAEGSTASAAIVVFLVAGSARLLPALARRFGVSLRIAIPAASTAVLPTAQAAIVVVIATPAATASVAVVALAVSPASVVVAVFTFAQESAAIVARRLGAAAVVLSFAVPVVFLPLRSATPAARESSFRIPIAIVLSGH